MKKLIKRIFKTIGLLLLAAALFVVGWRLLYGRDLLDSPHDLDKQAEIIATWTDDMADGTLTHEEIAIHYAPQIDQVDARCDYHSERK